VIVCVVCVLWLLSPLSHLHFRRIFMCIIFVSVVWLNRLSFTVIFIVTLFDWIIGSRTREKMNHQNFRVTATKDGSRHFDRNAGYSSGTNRTLCSQKYSHPNKCIFGIIYYVLLIQHLTPTSLFSILLHIIYSQYIF